MDFKRVARKVAQKASGCAKTLMEEKRLQEIADLYDFNGYERIYLVHIRKTGGTSLNNMFLALSGQKSTDLYLSLATTSNHRILCNGLIYVGWNVRLINSGNYFYAFSHTPLYDLDLPAKTFTVTCFHDPVKRIVSHYNMLMDFNNNNVDHDCLIRGRGWLGDSFDDFIERIPREFLLNQLFMFSPDLNVDEAVSSVMGLSHYFFTDNFSSGVNVLNQQTGLELKSMHIRKAKYSARISDDSLVKLRDKLSDEYRFLDIVHSSRPRRS